MLAQPWTSNADNAWHPVPGLAISISLANSGPVAVTHNLSVIINSHYVTRVQVDGKVVAGSQQVHGNTTYGTSASNVFLVLPAGTHQIVLQYRTPASFAFDPTTDYQAATLQVMTFDG